MSQNANRCYICGHKESCHFQYRARVWPVCVGVWKGCRKPGVSCGYFVSTPKIKRGQKR